MLPYEVNPPAIACARSDGAGPRSPLPPLPPAPTPHRLLPARKHLAAGQVERRRGLPSACRHVPVNRAQQPLLAHAVDQPADVRPVLRAGAHGAGFDGGDQRATPQQIRRNCRAASRASTASAWLTLSTLRCSSSTVSPSGATSSAPKGWCPASIGAPGATRVGAAQVATASARQASGSHHGSVAPGVPRCAQPVVRFSITENSSYIAIAMAPTTTRPAKASAHLHAGCRR